jgi:serine/threonine-protein kinase
MPAATFEVGTFVGSGRYEILIPLGTGAMGSVYKARDTRLDREVALKALSGALLSHPTARERMGREARALARIEHRNVVQIRDVFDEGPVLVLVLELVTGGDLAERARSAALDQGEVMALMEGVLTGLEAIHEVGIIHRDIKPSNVLLTEAGIPKLTDLGIAHDSRGRAMTGMGAQLGTAEYMSPEQVRGQAVDERTDIYAAGVMLYELLAHRVPFTGESDFDICHAHVHEAPNLKPLENNVSEHLIEVCLAAVVKERGTEADISKRG